MASSNRERILIVESDPGISDLIAPALQSCGYQTTVVGDASTAISRIVQVMPDLVLCSLDLPGLSSKDLMLALSAQGMTIPVIVIARKGAEADIIQAFRVGAVDFLLWPSREVEIIHTVERVLRQVHERREQEQLQRQLQQSNQELQARVRELTTMLAIGKGISAITDLPSLFERLTEAALKAAQADLGWLVVRDDSLRAFRLAAQHGLPVALANHLHQAWDDGISPRTAISGETLSLHGEALKLYQISSLGQSALIVPIKAGKQVLGVLVLMRKAAAPFAPGEQRLLETMADFAAIAMVNAHFLRK